MISLSSSLKWIDNIVDGQALKVLIVGCGNIAGKFDMNANKPETPYTHAGAYFRDDRFSIVACIDPDEAAREKFMAYWGVPYGYSSWDDMVLSLSKFDIISICSPTDLHENDALRAIHFKPKLIFCEKPVTKSSSSTKQLLDMCQQSDVLLCINYTRRWDPEIDKLKVGIQNNSYGVLRSVIGTYNKGILNNGSHLIDLLHYLVGTLDIKMVLEGESDYFENDQSIPALLTSKNGVPIHLATAHAEDYALFEVQFIFSSGVLTMQNGGLSWLQREAIESDQFAGYKVLDAGDNRLGQYQQAMTRAVDNIYHAVTSNAKLASDGNSAYNAQVMCEKIAHYGQV